MKQKGVLYRIFQWAEIVIPRMADVTVASSPKALAGSSSRLRETMGKTEIIGDGVDVEHFYPGYPSDAIPQEFSISIPVRVKVVGFLGLLTEYQGLSVLLEAIPHVVRTRERVHFLIMGYPSVEFYRAKAKALGIRNIHGKGGLRGGSEILAVCHVGVSPKLLSTEANSKLLNYMAMGLPVVASDTPVNRQILGHFGVYAEVGNPISLAGALLKVLSSDEYALDLGARLREKAVAEYSWRSIGERIAEVYQRAIVAWHERDGSQVVPLIVAFLLGDAS